MSPSPTENNMWKQLRRALPWSCGTTSGRNVLQYRHPAQDEAKTQQFDIQMLPKIFMGYAQTAVGGGMERILTGSRLGRHWELWKHLRRWHWTSQSNSWCSLQAFGNRIACHVLRRSRLSSSRDATTSFARSSWFLVSDSSKLHWSPASNSKQIRLVLLSETSSTNGTSMAGPCSLITGWENSFQHSQNATSRVGARALDRNSVNNQTYSFEACSITDNAQETEAAWIRSKEKGKGHITSSSSWQRHVRYSFRWYRVRSHPPGRLGRRSIAWFSCSALRAPHLATPGALSRSKPDADIQRENLATRGRRNGTRLHRHRGADDACVSEFHHGLVHTHFFPWRRRGQALQTRQQSKNVGRRVRTYPSGLLPRSEQRRMCCAKHDQDTYLYTLPLQWICVIWNIPNWLRIFTTQRASNASCRRRQRQLRGSSCPHATKRFEFPKMTA